MKFKKMYLVIVLLVLSIMSLPAGSNAYIPQFDAWIQPLNGEPVPAHYFYSLEIGQEYSLSVVCYYRKNKTVLFGPSDLESVIAFLAPLKMKVTPTSYVNEVPNSQGHKLFSFRAPIFEEKRTESDRLVLTFKLEPQEAGEQVIRFLYDSVVDEYYTKEIHLKIE